MSDDDDSDSDIPTLVDLDLDLTSTSNSTPNCISNNIIETENNNNTTTGSAIQEDKNEQDNTLPPVPVTILSGFLGSGKTTLIQYILNSPNHGKKIAVIENEFSGAAASAAITSPMIMTNSTLGGTDAIRSNLREASLGEREGLNIETLIARDGSSPNYDNGNNLIDLVELPNGCVCCTIKDTLVETLDSLLEKKKELEYIIIELSGMANPGPCASIFWLDDAVDSRLYLDGIITCVDARNIESQLNETSSAIHAKNNGNNIMTCMSVNTSDGMGLRGIYNDDNETGGDEAAQQIAFADRIIINKIDLLPSSSSASPPQSTDESVNGDDKLNHVISLIRSINGTAPLQTTTFSTIPDLKWILDTQCFDVTRAKEVDRTFSEPTNAFLPTTNSPQKWQGIGSKHKHTSSITTVALIEQGSINMRRIHSWLATILWPDQDEDNQVLSAQQRELEKLDVIVAPPDVALKKAGGNGSNNSMSIFRIKGILSVMNNDDDVLDEDAVTQSFTDENGLDRRKFIVQAVNDLWDIHPANESLNWSHGEERISKLVVIGRHLDREKLRSDFKKCFHHPSPEPHPEKKSRTRNARDHRFVGSNNSSAITIDLDRLPQPSSSTQYSYFCHDTVEDHFFPTNELVPNDTLCRFLVSKGSNGRGAKLSPSTVRTISETSSPKSSSPTTTNENAETNRQTIQYANGSTYNIRRKYLLPIIQHPRIVIVAPETDQYRRLCSIHTMETDAFCEIGCAFGLTVGSITPSSQSSKPSSSSLNRKRIGIDKSRSSLDIAIQNFPSNGIDFIECDVLIENEDWWRNFSQAHFRTDNSSGENTSQIDMNERSDNVNDLVVGIDINGNRELEAVLECLCRTLDWWSPRLVVVKSRSLYQALKSSS